MPFLRGKNLSDESRSSPVSKPELQCTDKGIRQIKYRRKIGTAFTVSGMWEVKSLNDKYH